MTFTELIDKIEIWDHWQGEYTRFVPQFVAEASTGKNWEDWDNDLFYEFFMRSADQCVSSLRQGYFTHAEKDLIKRSWPELSTLLQKIALSQEQPLFETYHQIKELIRMYTGNNKKAATNRLIAGLQPQLLCTIVNQDKLGQLVYLLNTHVEDFKMELTYDWFEDSHHLLQIFKEKLDKNGFEIVTLPWQVYDYFQEQNNPSFKEQNDMSENKLEQQIQILEYKKQIILQGPPGTGKTRQAKELAVELLGLNDRKELKNNPQFKIIQFHPSYTYEDFVRGIVSQPNEDGDGILFKAENRVLADMAHMALQNYKASQNTPDTIISKDTFEIFIEKVKDEMAENELHQYPITNSVYLFSADETKFKYKGDNWDAHKNGLNMKFSELKLIIESGAKERQDIKKMSDVEEKTRQHATYFMKVVEKYYEFEKNYQPETIRAEKVQLKNYVLVIDEINRANLSSVLGELIYALEYRGKAVESMYALEDATNEDKNKLILPPNLYIIGTMNTADRSVGHIDYAIRRRFAFIDVLPESLEHDTSIHFNTDGFEKVSQLFLNGNVSGEFEAKDVQLGHSYFIAKNEDLKDGQTKEEIFRMKMNYEVVPILLEYVKDGVLIGSHEGKDIKEYINDLKINN
ncbi:MoxR-like ATPase [Chryseobacterium bernardetii]|uniref:5-methylcytosine-specific restriction endonuclease McrBC GTP-binding regulatory subunit McrB n=2 Tax=Chryseobacterium TaxID=59732 RepID=A0A543ELN5_9FLAO|nr:MULTISPECIES: AAA family ATPase [Chryseobacterium]MDR6368882.1 MoxR-like ATPase [Chryseobacterium vietnamense]MDR6440195.1 MoxR-like ATPase [Chryseobacterium bernardetii]TQM22493.1 5-methylcytosine-specific restriction endonuclease McrBC GTP-binding regulatory subunit McrB [Chryseobacterium aquifrigidense]